MERCRLLKSSSRRINQNPDDSLTDAVSVTRFWSLVDQTGECWNWRGDTDRNGYGVFVWRGKRHGAHALALSFTTGELRADELDTCHSCDNPACCNPDHLRFDTRFSNVQDMDSRGRRSVPNARLTPDQVITMRTRRANGAPQTILTRDYGISAAYVSEIVRGRTWKDAGGPLQEKNAQYERTTQ